MPRGNDYGVISLGLFFRLISLILVGDLFLNFRVRCFNFLCWWLLVAIILQPPVTNDTDSY